MLGPMLGREESSIPIRSIVAVGNEKGFNLAIVVFNGDFHGPLPDILHTGAAITFDDFIGLK